MNTLYKKDTKGKIRFLRVTALGDQLTRTSGIVGGAEVKHIKTVKGKNIGKSNETSFQEQCRLEAEALLKKKKQEGYFDTKEEAENEEVIMPMLAKKYEDHKNDIDWDNCSTQPKLDGMRCLAFVKNNNVRLMSRKGVEITTMPHIVEELLEFSLDFRDDCTQIFDGELYSHGKTFQENMSLIKKYRKGKSEDVKFHIYDMVTNKTFKNRIEEIGYKIGLFDYIEVVTAFQAKNINEVERRHSYNIGMGYEGTMIRQGIKGYKKNGRCSQLLKYKDFIDETYKVVDVIPMEVYEKQGMIVCVTNDGKEFVATPKMSHEQREVLLNQSEDYIGKTAEVRFFEYTDDGIPRFPIFYGLRLDK